MKNVSMMPVVMPRIGVDPDGNPVYYDPEKAKESKYPKNPGIYNPVMQINPQVLEIIKERRKQDYIKANDEGLERTPNNDMFMSGANNLVGASKLGTSVGASLKIPPEVKEAASDIAVDLIKQYGVEAGMYLWNLCFGDDNKNAGQDVNQVSVKAQPSYDYIV